MSAFHQFVGLAVLAWSNAAWAQALDTVRQPIAQAPGQPAAQVQKQTGQAKPTDASHKPKKVYTEDDFKAKGFHGSYEGAEVDISDINLCDQSCFNQLISGTTFNARESDQRKELTLQAIEN